MHINYEIDVIKAEFKDIRSCQDIMNLIYQLSIQYFKSYSILNTWRTFEKQLVYNKLRHHVI